MRSKWNRDKCRRDKEWDRRHRKFYGFVYRLQNNYLKESETLALGLMLRSDNIRKCYHPLRWISQEEIDSHYNNPETWESGEFDFPCIEALVNYSGANPYRGRNGFWLIYKPGFYRVGLKPIINSEGRVFKHKYFMHYYNGMPNLKHCNGRNYNNDVSRAFHRVLKYYRKIEDQIHERIMLIQQTKTETYNRLKNKQIMRKFMERELSRKRARRVRDVTPTQETKSFFQALAIGSIFKEEASL